MIQQLQFLRQQDMIDIPCHLVGNKLDLYMFGNNEYERQVTLEDVEKVTEQYGKMKAMDVSAKCNINVSKVMENLALDILKNREYMTACKDEASKEDGNKNKKCALM